MPFLFEKLDCYRKAVIFADEIDTFLERGKTKISHTLRDQLSRASLSIALNLAEGNGRLHYGDKRQFFYIARGSTFECIPLLHLLRSRTALTKEEYDKFYLDAEELSKMIGGLIKSLEIQRIPKSAS